MICSNVRGSFEILYYGRREMQTAEEDITSKTFTIILLENFF